ncbi:mucin-2 [Anopheles bellator]|uniref:mucin-2 n=1 Tax=Anopheles bellator TaxID=139047 RepID=UPI002649E601|nr:mucin-2 [Anopheles bellator]
MQQVDDPPYLTVGTEVSAKYKGAFCEAKVRKVVRNIKCKVAYKHQGLGSGVVSDDQIKGALRVGATVEVRHPERKEYVEATLTKIQDCSQYTVVFDDGDITTLRRSALCLKSGRHFNESETLDQLPLTHPEHFGNPVIGGRRGRRSRHLMPDDSSDEDDEPTPHSRSAASDKEENIGKVVCVETSDNKKKNPKENWFPGLVVAPTAQDTVRIRVKDEYLVRSFKDGRYYTVPKKEASEFTRDSVNKSEAAAVSAAIEYMDNDVLPPHWDREALFGMAASCSDSEQELETDSSDDEPTEEKDHFVAQLYKFMDDRGTPLNKVPSIINRDVNLYRLFRAVQKLHGYNRVTSQNQWKQIALRLGFSPATASITNLVKQAYKKFLFSFEEFNRKLGCTMVPHPKTSRSKGRSLVRASSVQSPKLPEKEKLTAKERAAAVAAAACVNASANASSGSSGSGGAGGDATGGATGNSAVDESGNTSESSTAESATLRPTTSSKRKAVAHGGSKVRALVDKFEEKDKDRDKEKSGTSYGAKSADGGGKKEEKDGGPMQGTVVAMAVTGKKEKVASKLASKTIDTIVEKRGRKRKDADSVDSKRDDREGSSGGGGSGGSGGNTTVGGGPSSAKPERLSAASSSATGGSGGSGPNGGGPGSGSGTAGHSRGISPGGASAPDFPIEAGDKLKVYYDEQKVTYEAKVIEIAIQEGSPIYLVHYTGWNTRYDEWVRKERIAENLTNNKTKKGKSNSSSSSSNNAPAGGKSGPGSGGDKTPRVGKRIRGNSKGDGGPGGGGMTPRATTPNVGRTKSPATPSNRRPLTRGGSAANSGSLSSVTAAAAALAGRRTSNNTDISSSLSVPTDPDNTSDTDSDEPMMKKCTTNSTSSTTSSNSSISISSTSTKVSTTAEAGSSSDAAAISDEFSNGAATKGGGGGRDYDLKQIRSEMKGGFKELKSPGSPASDTTTTTTTTTTATGAAGDGPSVSSNPSTDLARHKLQPKQEATTARSGTALTTSVAQVGGTVGAIKEEPTIGSCVKEEESTVTEEDDEPGKSSESETLSEEDSSQSSNKAFSSSPITTMVDSDTAETPLQGSSGGTLIVSSPKLSSSPERSGVLCDQEDSSSTDAPLVRPGTTAAAAAAAARMTEGKGLLGSIKPEPTVVKEESSPSVSKPPIKTYGTAATIIANSEKMAFCSLRDVSSEPGASVTIGDAKPHLESIPTGEAVKQESPVKAPPLDQSLTPVAQGSWSKKEEVDVKVSHLPTAKQSQVTQSAVAASKATVVKSEPGSPAQSVITITSPGTGGLSGQTKAIKSPKSSSLATLDESAGSVIGKTLSNVLSASSISSTSAVPVPAAAAVMAVAPVSVAPFSIAHAAGSNSSTLAALRAEKKHFSTVSSSTAANLAGVPSGVASEKKGALVSSNPVSAVAGPPSANVGPLKHGTQLLGEKKHFSSSTLTPAQNKLLSKEALSIKSIFESTANRMDEKISDIYEFKEAEDEFDDQEATGASRKLVSDVPPAEVVSSLTPALVASPVASAGTTALLDDKRKKPLQRKALHNTEPQIDTTPLGSGGYSAVKRTKKVSPHKPVAAVELPTTTEPAKPAKIGVRRETKEKDDQTDPTANVRATPAVPVDKTTPQKAAILSSSVATTVVPAAGLTTPFSTIVTPVKSDSTFDVLRKSPSFNLVATPLTKDEAVKAQEETKTTTTAVASATTASIGAPPLVTATAPGIFTPVIAGTPISASGDRSSSGNLMTAPGKGPSTSVLLAIAVDDKQKEEPTLENCKKYFNDMNFEFDAPTVKKPPSIADKVLKALSQQQQQQQQQHSMPTVKSEKMDFLPLKFMASSMHHHPLMHSSKPTPIASSALGALDTPLAISCASSIVPSTGGSGVSSVVKLESSATLYSLTPVPLKADPSVAEQQAKKEPTPPVTPVRQESEEPSRVVPMVGALKQNNSPLASSATPTTVSVLLKSPSQQSAGSHGKLLDHIPPAARNNDLTESIGKLDDPRSSFAHDDESTDSNDSEHRLIIEDAESQGSGEPPLPSGPAHLTTFAAATPPTTDRINAPGQPERATTTATAVIVHYDQSMKLQTSNVVCAKKELFEEKPRTSITSTAATVVTSSQPSTTSITLEMASAASAAAVAAVADKEKIIFGHDATTTASQPKDEPISTPSTVHRTPPSSCSSGAITITTVVVADKPKAPSGGGAKQSLLETIIQSELNTVNRGLGSESYLKLKEQTDHQAEIDRLQQQVALTVSSSSSVPSTSVITTSSGIQERCQLVDDKLGQQSSSQQQQQQANNESLSLLLCEETIPGSPAPKDHDRLPPASGGRKVYAEPPLASAFLPPQSIQTASDLKHVPMDLEPPVVTITIAGNTTISSTSSVQGGGAPFGHASQQSSRVMGPLGAKGGGESAVDTPNSSPRDSVSQDETHDQESSPLKKRRQRKPSEEPTHKRRRTVNSSFGGGGYSSANNGGGSSSGYGRSQRGTATNNASDSEDNSDSLAAFHRASALITGGKSGRAGQYNFLVNLDPSLNTNQRIAILKKKIQELRKTYNAIKAELASIDRRRKKLRRRERENKKQAKLNSASATQ